MTATLVWARPATEVRSVPTAASTAVADLLTGRRRPARVVVSTRHALVVAVDAVDGEPSPDGFRDQVSTDDLSLVCLSGPQAVRLPCALLLPSRPPTLPVGTPATIGGGLLRVGGTAFSVGRWWRVPQPHVADSAQARERAGALALPPLEASLARPAQQLAAALHGGEDLTQPVRALVGLGCGLTPGGDDVVAGAMVALHATGAPSAHRLSAAVAAAEPVLRTTTISAGLLRHAARGECVPELAALLAALDGRGQLRPAIHRLLAVGHSSGTSLCHGAVLAIAGLRPPFIAEMPTDPKDRR